MSRPPSMAPSVHPALAALSGLKGIESLALKLKERLHPQTLLPRHEDKDTKRAKDERDFYRRQFIAGNVVDNAIKDIITQHEMATEVVSSEEDRAVNRLRAVYTAAELEDYLPLGDTTSSLLGLSQTDLQLGKPLSKEDKAIVESKIEEQLLEQCEQLMAQLGHGRSDTDDPSFSSASRYDRASGLAELVRAELEGTRERLVFSETEFQSDWQALHVHMKNFHLVEAMAREHKMKAQAQGDAVNVKHQAAKCKALVLKIRCLELDVLLSTYTGPSVQALKKIRSHLKSAIAKAEADIERTKASLVQYEAVGDEFGAVVKEYAHVKEEIAGAKWALQQLKREPEEKE